MELALIVDISKKSSNPLISRTIWFDPCSKIKSSLLDLFSLSFITFLIPPPSLSPTRLCKIFWLLPSTMFFTGKWSTKRSIPTECFKVERKKKKKNKPLLRCVRLMCMKDGESNDHLFIHFKFARGICDVGILNLLGRGTN